MFYKPIGKLIFIINIYSAAFVPLLSISTTINLGFY